MTDSGLIQRSVTRRNWNWIGLPIAKFGMAMYGHPLELAPADISEMMPVLFGMLGLGALRTAEKVNGVAAK